jgi:hypothetical protein
MSTEQLLQIPAVRTDRFNITGFAKYSTVQYSTVQGTVIKQNLRTTELKPK